jgi:hypothetical protein
MSSVELVAKLRKLERRNPVRPFAHAHLGSTSAAFIRTRKLRSCREETLKAEHEAVSE